MSNIPLSCLHIVKRRNRNLRKDKLQINIPKINHIEKEIECLTKSFKNNEISNGLYNIIMFSPFITVSLVTIGSIIILNLI